jgi:hypothetical protein
MSEATNLVYQSIDHLHADQPAATRRRLVAGTAAALGGMGLLGLVGEAEAAPVAAARTTDEKMLLNIAATAEVLATIVNTVGGEQPESFFDSLPGGSYTAAVTKQNIRAAAREELIHYRVLTSLGARPLTTTIYVPNAYLASPQGLLSALEIGDQIFVNAYLIAVTTFANNQAREGRDGMLARVAAEFCGVEAVHRALARQSLGKLGNDRPALLDRRGVERPLSQPQRPGLPAHHLGGHPAAGGGVRLRQGGLAPGDRLRVRCRQRAHAGPGLHRHGAAGRIGQHGRAALARERRSGRAGGRPRPAGRRRSAPAATRHFVGADEPALEPVVDPDVAVGDSRLDAVGEVPPPVLGGRVVVGLAVEADVRVGSLGERQLVRLDRCGELDVRLPPRRRAARAPAHDRR